MTITQGDCPNVTTRVKGVFQVFGSSGTSEQPIVLAFIGSHEWLIVLAFVLLFFGAKRIPELARSLGKAITEFRKGAKDIRDDLNLDDSSQPADRDNSNSRSGRQDA